MTLSEKAAYIRGLAEGLDLDADRKEVRVINELIELVSIMAIDLEDVSEDLTSVIDMVEEIDEDLMYVEEEVYGDDEEDFGDEFYEIACPNCDEVVVLDEEMLLGGDVVCPSCGEKIEIEIDTCECGCGSDEE